MTLKKVTTYALVVDPDWACTAQSGADVSNGDVTRVGAWAGPESGSTTSHTHKNHDHELTLASVKHEPCNMNCLMMCACRCQVGYIRPCVKWSNACCGACCHGARTRGGFIQTCCQVAEHYVLQPFARMIPGPAEAIDFSPKIVGAHSLKPSIVMAALNVRLIISEPWPLKILPCALALLRLVGLECPPVTGPNTAQQKLGRRPRPYPQQGWHRRQRLARFEGRYQLQKTRVSPCSSINQKCPSCWFGL